MKKQLLSFASLVALAATYPSLHLVAAPPNGAASTEESDRKFLNNLESSDAAKSAPTAATSQPQVLPAPVDPAAPAVPQPRPVASEKQQTVIRGNWDEPAVAAAPAQRSTRSATRSAATAVTPRTDTAQTRTPTVSPVHRDAVTARSRVSDVQSEETVAVPATPRRYRTRTVEGSAAVTAKSTARNVPEETTSDEEGTHIVRPAEVAEYGVAPSVPAKTTKVTTTYVEQPATTVTTEKRNPDRDEDKHEEHRLFHRLFHGGIFSKHGDD